MTRLRGFNDDCRDLAPVEGVLTAVSVVCIEKIFSGLCSFVSSDWLGQEICFEAFGFSVLEEKVFGYVLLGYVDGFGLSV